MKELDFIKTIKDITNSNYIGDDCAYIKDLGIVVTQDNFIENVHFKTSWATPYQIGYKAVAVNISDILASGAKPEYISIGLSLPPHMDKAFIEELYKGIVAGSYGAKITGGDITGGEKIFISICAIGSTLNRNISSRAYAKPKYVVIASGEFGSSAEGLDCLKSGIKYNEYINEHLEPKLNPAFSELISTSLKDNYAMMDTSDGLADALFKVADKSNVTIKIKKSNIPHNINIQDYNKILYGGEDYKLIAAVPKYFLKNLSEYKYIGEVINRVGNTKLIIDDDKIDEYSSLNAFNHFT